MPSKPRSTALRQLTRLFRVGRFADTHQLSSQEALEIARDQESRALSRRTFLGGAAATTALALTAGRAKAAPRTNLDVGIVGAGIAGLQCASELARVGIAASVYEANTRVGGRQFSLRGFFPGQTCERGGEFIDNLHKTLLGWVNELGLTREDVNKVPGEVTYFFDGQHVPEATVVDEFRVLVAAMHDDLRASSGAPTADYYNAADLELDHTNLTEYLISRGAGKYARKAIEATYITEYGREAAELSSLNFLYYIHADRRSKFTPFGSSDERFHVVQGNDAIATGIAARLPRAPQLDLRLERVARTASGRIELSFRQGNSTVVRTHDHVVLAIPFSVLRLVDLDASLALPAWKLTAINEMGYGDNAKMMVGFQGPYWGELGAKGVSYSDLPNHQCTWESNVSNATSEHAVLVDYSAGIRGKNLDPNKPQLECARFLGDLDKVFPGANAKVVRNNGKYLVHLEHWPSNPQTRGSYTAYLPGQFTTIAGNESKSIGNLHFAGEHTNSFYIWQGFMEGAALSGIAAAAAVRG